MTTFSKAGRLLAAWALLAASAAWAGPDPAPPAPAGARGVVIEPGVSLKIVTASGMAEFREDWSLAAGENLARAFVEELAARGHPFEVAPFDITAEGRLGQVLRLHQRVVSAISWRETLPGRIALNHPDLSLGDGAGLLRQGHAGDYALFVGAEGGWSSGGRKAVAVGSLLSTHLVSLGGQRVSVTLVELATGHIIWWRTTNAAPGEDIREAEGARSVVRRMLAESPL